MSGGSPHPEAETDGPVDQDGPFLTRGESASGLEPGGRVTTPETGVQALRGEMRASSPMDAVEALAALLEPEAFNPDQLADEGWRARTQDTALGYAGLVIASGYRRVVEDDDTIERLAEVLAKADGWFPWAQPVGVEQEVAVGDDIKDGFRSMARAVVRALREET